MQALAAIRRAGARVVELGSAIEDAGFPGADHEILADIGRIPDVPVIGGLEGLFDLDPAQARAAAAPAEMLRDLDERLAANPLHGRLSAQSLEIASRLARTIREPDRRTVPCAQLLRLSEEAVERNHRIAERHAALAPVLELLGMSDDIPLAALDTLAAAPIVAAAAPQEFRDWLSCKTPRIRAASRPCIGPGRNCATPTPPWSKSTRSTGVPAPQV